MQNMQLLADPKKIQAFLNDLKNSNHISIDIEFMRRNTYFPEPCVMQISNGKIHTCKNRLRYSRERALQNVKFYSHPGNLVSYCNPNVP